MNHTRPLGARQEPSAADCRHSRAVFDASFREALKGRGLTSDDRVVHAYLVSQARMAKGAPVAVTIAEVAEDCEISYHHAWASLKHLADQGLVKKVRRGLGLSNTYELLPIPGALETEDIVGKRQPESGVRPVRGEKSGQSGSPARAFIPSKKKAEERGDIRSKTAADYYQTSEGWKITPRT